MELQESDTIPHSVKSSKATPSAEPAKRQGASQTSKAKPKKVKVDLQKEPSCDMESEITSKNAAAQRNEQPRSFSHTSCFLMVQLEFKIQQALTSLGPNTLRNK